MLSLSPPSTKTQQIERIVLFEREETNVRRIVESTGVHSDGSIHLRSYAIDLVEDCKKGETRYDCVIFLMDSRRAQFTASFIGIVVDLLAISSYLSLFPQSLIDLWIVYIYIFKYSFVHLFDSLGGKTWCTVIPCCNSLNSCSTLYLPRVPS